MQTNSEEFLWAQKYRPKKIEDCILSSKLKKQIADFIQKGDTPNYIFQGPSGTGKTTAALAIINELDADYIMLNGSGEDRGIDVVKTKILNFATTMSLTSRRKIVLYDEADNLTTDSQMALRGIMESVSSSCGFILTCNYHKKLIDAIHSRSVVLDFRTPQEEIANLKKQFFVRVTEILKNEKVEFDKKVVAEIVKQNFPDNRKILNSLQAASASGSIDVSAIERKSKLDDLVGFMKEKDWKSARQWVAEVGCDDPLSIILEMFKRDYEIFEGKSLPVACMILNDHQNSHVHAADPQLNLIACVTHLMHDCTFR